MQLKDRELLKRYIGKQGLNISGRQLAERAGVSQALVGFLISGRRNSCSKGTASKIEGALGCPPGLLFVESTSVVRADGKRVEVSA